MRLLVSGQFGDFGLLASQQPPVVGGTALAGAVFLAEGLCRLRFLHKVSSVPHVTVVGHAAKPLVARAQPFLTTWRFEGNLHRRDGQAFRHQCESVTNLERPLLHDLGVFLCGGANAQTRELIWSMLEIAAAIYASGSMGCGLVPRR